MKLLFTSDIHQMNSKWKQLVKVCKDEKPDIVGIAGDIFPKDRGIPDQLSFLPHLKKYAQKIKDNSGHFLIMLGNDDNQLLIPEMEKEHGNLWSYIPEKAEKLNGVEFAGMPWVPDYPFGYKFWCAPESRSDLRIDQCYDPVVLNADNRFESISSMTKYFETKKSIWESLTETAKKVNDIPKSIWMIHSPPSNCGLDVCAHGAKVGSNSVLKFIKEYQPFITIHGHIHESPEYNGKNWYCRVGQTMCIQGGQIGFDLHYVVMEVTNSVIKSMRHSIYGDAVL